MMQASDSTTGKHLHFREKGLILSVKVKRFTWEWNDTCHDLQNGGAKIDGFSENNNDCRRAAAGV